MTVCAELVEEDIAGVVVDVIEDSAVDVDVVVVSEVLDAIVVGIEV